MTDLLPCPFCGAEPLLVTHSSEVLTEYSVRCYGGCCESCGGEDRGEAIKHWNTRAALKARHTQAGDGDNGR